MEAPTELRVFSFSELKKATHNFIHTSILGEGSFGEVYKGSISVEEESSSSTRNIFNILRCGAQSSKTNVVAVKRLSSASMFGMNEWQNEVVLLGSHCHPNLIKLIGYCGEDKELLLVYEYMPNGSLDKHLYNGNFHSEPLTWRRRVNIALGVARGLTFLHAQDRPIIFRDLKSSDILLDKNWNAKISDFGVAKLGPADKDSYVSTRIVGSCGICAPEYVSTAHLFVKSDVYMFGVVLVELLIGLRVTPLTHKFSETLSEWASSRLGERKTLNHTLDDRIKDGDEYTMEEIFEIAQLTLRCLQDDQKMRPAMAEVVEIIEGICGV